MRRVILKLKSLLSYELVELVGDIQVYYINYASMVLTKTIKEKDNL